MNPPSADSYVLPRWLRSWEQFWFTPGDPAVLALMRLSCGLIVVYTMLIYSFKLQEFMGAHAWHSLELRMDAVHSLPVMAGPLDWTQTGRIRDAKDNWEVDYYNSYRQKWGYPPPPPYPEGPDREEQAAYLEQFRFVYGYDLRLFGITIPKNAEEKAYVEKYAKEWHFPPPAYPKTEAENLEIQKYMETHNGVDPRRLFALGTPIFSLWFHVTDPTAMMILHGLIIFIAICFTAGFCTRLSSAALWFGSLCYIHRNPTVLFGVDTMMTILLFYLMMSPCGQVFSVDRALRKWWVKAKPGVVAWACRLLRLPAPANLAPADPVPAVPTPSVAANVVTRLLQIHICIIYAASGLTKLQGRSWWDGSAIWMTLGNYEFAPMQFEAYLWFLRFIGEHQLLFDGFMTASGLFTLTFEVGYAFLIWRPKLRWVFLGSAILLHAGIGLFLGLKTFSLMMLVMNMAFLRKEEAYWIFSVLANPRKWLRPKPAAPTPALAAAASS